VLTIATPLPDWPTGFTSELVRRLIDGAARGYLPWYALHPLPPLYTSGVRYRLEPGHGSGVDEFANPWLTHARGWGDCDDLVTWYLVEQLAKGVRAMCGAEWNGQGVHVWVRMPNGQIVDPSRDLA